MNKPWYRPLEEWEGIDEITIKQTPRFKTSGLSGDEWRVSAVVTFKRKGQVVYERPVHRMEEAAAFLPWLLRVEVGENHPPRARGLYGHYPDECAQPGCDKPPVNHYRIKKLYEHGHGPLPDDGQENRRAFCEGHSHRGDSDMEDNDENYELIQGEGHATIDPSKVSPAAFGGVVEVDQKDLDRRRRRG